MVHLHKFCYCTLFLTDLPYYLCCAVCAPLCNVLESGADSNSYMLSVLINDCLCVLFYFYGYIIIVTKSTEKNNKSQFFV